LCKTLIDSNVTKNFNVLTASLNVLHNYFGPNKIIFRSVSTLKMV